MEVNDETVLSIANVWARWAERESERAVHGSAKPEMRWTSGVMGRAWKAFASAADSALAGRACSTAALRLVESDVAASCGDRGMQRQLMEDGLDEASSAYDAIETSWLLRAVYVGGLLNAHGDTALAEEYYRTVVSEPLWNMPWGRQRRDCIEACREAATQLLFNHAKDIPTLQSFAELPAFQDMFKTELAAALKKATRQ